MIATIFTPFPVLQTDRLILRQLETTDDKDIFFHRSDGGVNKYLEGFRHTSIEQTHAFIEKIQKGVENNEFVFWIIIQRETNKFIGTICLWNVSKEESKAETGYTLSSDFQGKGYMQEALVKVIDFGFNKMKLKIIEAYTHKSNDRSTKLLLKNKFKPDVTYKAPEDSKDLLFVLTNETVLSI